MTPINNSSEHKQTKHLTSMHNNQRIKLTPNEQLISLNQFNPRKKNQAHSLRQEGEKIKMEFEHTFQEYLKLALCKLIPHQGVLVDPQQGLIYGLQEKCQSFKKKVQRELSKHQFKKIELKKEHDLDALQYELDREFKVHIYRPRFIQKALEAISQYSCFQTSTNTFLKILKHKIIIIVRAREECMVKFLKNLEDILRKSTNEQPKKHCPVLTESASIQAPYGITMEKDYEEVEADDEDNYYKMMQKKKKEVSQMEKEKISYSISESSSFSWTKTETSHQMEMGEEQYDTSLNLTSQAGSSFS